MAREIITRLNRHPNPAVDPLPVGASIHGAGAQERERVVVCASVIDSDVPEHVVGDLLRQVDVNAQEVGCGDVRNM